MQKRKPEIIEFCDLSSDLDTRIRFLADLAQATDPQRIIFDDCLSEFGHNLIEYLGRRTLLEHVFFGRNLRFVRLEQNQLKAELWRLYKIRASYRLKAKAHQKSGNRSKQTHSRLSSKKDP